MTVEIIFVLIDNEETLYVNGDPSPAQVWKKDVTIHHVAPQTDTNYDWCYDRITELHPDYDEYTVAIWAVDKTPN